MVAAGQGKALEFLTGYLIEYSLSIDNIFVFVLIFSFFRVPAEYQHRVLFWGILSALILRGAMIGLGVQLVERFAWVMYLFGAFLVLTGLKMLFSRQAGGENLEDNLVNRWCGGSAGYGPVPRRELPGARGRRVAPDPAGRGAGDGRGDGRALRGGFHPAIFGVTRDPFIVYTSTFARSSACVRCISCWQEWFTGSCT